MTNWYIYLIRCVDNSLYTGITTNVERRFKEHSKGTGAKYLKPRRPLTLVFSRPVGSRSQASKLEYAIKQLPKAKKELLVAGVLDFESVTVSVES